MQYYEEIVFEDIILEKEISKLEMDLGKFAELAEQMELIFDI